MPDGMSGYDLARQLQAEQPQLKVIYSSGYPGESTVRPSPLTEGANFLPKPYSPRKLAALLRKNLDSR